MHILLTDDYLVLSTQDGPFTFFNTVDSIQDDIPYLENVTVVGEFLSSEFEFITYNFFYLTVQSK